MFRNGFRCSAFSRHCFIDMRAQAIGDLGGAALLRGLVEKPAMESLNLNGCGLGCESGRALAQSLPSMVELTILHLQQNNLDQAAAEAGYLPRCCVALFHSGCCFARRLLLSIALLRR